MFPVTVQGSFERPKLLAEYDLVFFSSYFPVSQTVSSPGKIKNKANSNNRSDSAGLAMVERMERLLNCKK